MGNFLIGLYFWTLQAMGMTGDELEPPKIYMAPHEQVVQSACAGAPDCKTPIYIDKNSIILDRSVDWMSNPYVASWVVHFMVHYIQARRSPLPANEAEAEMEAVDIANKFLFKMGGAQEAKI